MNRRPSLRLEYLEDRLTPTTRGVPILPPPAVNSGTTTVIVPSGSGHSMSPALGLVLGSSGSTGSGTGSSGGLGTGTGTPVGPGPGSS